MTESIRKKIIERYMKNVHGRKPDTSKSNQRHDGRGGHWLEKQMGVKPNADNRPDLWGYEMKDYTTSKTTFGDWSPNYRIYRDQKYKMPRDQFMKIFGQHNPKQNNRLSWSGKPVPKIGGTNSFGVKIVIDKHNNISFVYSHLEDTRDDKSSNVPKNLQAEDLTIARWDADGKKSLREKVERKFNKSGWFKCSKNNLGVYDSIMFGGPMNFETWIGYVKTGDIFFDSGMHQHNPRPYCQWRASNTFWDSLAVSRHP